MLTKLFCQTGTGKNSYKFKIMRIVKIIKQWFLRIFYLSQKIVSAIIRHSISALSSMMLKIVF